MIQIVVIALAWGFLSVVFPGFAKADSLEPVHTQVEFLQISFLDSQIYTIREKQCKMQAGQRDLVTQRLYALLDQYRQIARREYHLPACGDF